jgi:hypothetical protein
MAQSKSGIYIMRLWGKREIIMGIWLSDRTWAKRQRVVQSKIS